MIASCLTALCEQQIPTEQCKAKISPTACETRQKSSPSKGGHRSSSQKSCPIYTFSKCFFTRLVSTCIYYLTFARTTPKVFYMFRYVVTWCGSSQPDHKQVLPEFGEVTVICILTALLSGQRLITQCLQYILHGWSFQEYRSNSSKKFTLFIPNPDLNGWAIPSFKAIYRAIHRGRAETAYRQPCPSCSRQHF